MLRIRNLHKTFPVEEGEVRALRDLTLDVSEGEFLPSWVQWDQAERFNRLVADFLSGSP